jgi:hypothetical protein
MTDASTDTAVPAAASTEGLGCIVVYRDHDNRSKAAIVTATSKSVRADEPVTAPEDGRVHLYVFSSSGHPYFKENVPAGDGPSTFTLSAELEAALIG